MRIGFAFSDIHLQDSWNGFCSLWNGFCAKKHNHFKINYSYVAVYTFTSVNHDIGNSFWVNLVFMAQPLMYFQVYSHCLYTKILGKDCLGISECVSLLVRLKYLVTVSLYTSSYLNYLWF